MSLAAGCQIILIDLNFHLQKCLKNFDKDSADKIQFKNYREVNPLCLMPIRIKECRKQPLRTYCPNIHTVFLAAYSPRKFQPLGDVLEIGQKTASVGKWPTLGH